VLVDVIVLDYGVSSTGRLPYKIFSSSIHAAAKRGVAFELCYAPAVLDGRKRKGFVQVVREFMSASLNVRDPRPVLVVSSGDRSFENEDAGPMALRTPSDMSNALKTLTMLEEKVANNVMSANADQILEKIRDRERGYNYDLQRKVDVYEEGDDKFRRLPEPLKGDNEVFLPIPTHASKEKISPGSPEEEDDGMGDGFIAL